MLRWFPWRYVVSRVARARGLVDPIKILSRLESFGQPLEVKEPLELLRAGMVFHARGLMNSGVIQHNLDWLWPLWVERQYDPTDPSFIPRAFSITHVNLTHRNWTAVGTPDFDALPLVDPRGLATPFWDGWSLDAWILGEDGGELLPARAAEAEQRAEVEDGFAVSTTCREGNSVLSSRAKVSAEGSGKARLCLQLEGNSAARGWLVVSLRPYNPEGVSFVHDIEASAEKTAWRVDGRQRVEFSERPGLQLFSNYRRGDVLRQTRDGARESRIHCPVGMATAAAFFRLEACHPRRLEVTVPLRQENPSISPRPRQAARQADWNQILASSARLEIGDGKLSYLYETSLRTLVLHSPGEVYPGPFTYKRFWFRDAAFILAGLLAAGFVERAERTLDLFPERQTRRGHFLSQEGEWDSNGEALWILHRFCDLTGRRPKNAWRRSIRRGAHWILGKRLPDDGATPHAGLLPAGFSAEHLGPNDYYYWDDFWSVAGLYCAAGLLDALGDEGEARQARLGARSLEGAIERSLARAAEGLGRQAMPASPYRRLDSGAIGSLAVGYPLQLWPGNDPRIVDTAEALLERCFVSGGFFQDMVHSGINPYLTLHVAQVLLRAGDPRAGELFRTVCRLASPTGQWPEAVHPLTGGGCMGDGQHAWAAAEWVLYLRSCFVREEGDTLVLGSGIDPAWLGEGGVATFGPTPTPWGPVTVRVRDEGGKIRTECQGEWRGSAPRLRALAPGEGSGFPAEASP